MKYNENLSKNASASHSSFSNDTSDAPNITSPVLYQLSKESEQQSAPP